MNKRDPSTLSFEIVKQAELADHQYGNQVYDMLADNFQWYSPISSFCNTTEDGHLIIASGMGDVDFGNAQDQQPLAVSLVNFGMSHKEETKEQSPQAVIQRLLAYPYRNQGIGTLVLRHSEEFIASQGYSKAWIKPIVLRNERLYERNGYRYTVPSSAMMSKLLQVPHILPRRP